MPPIAQDVSFSGSTTPELNGYLVRPDGAGPFPALVVVHEIFGLNDDIKAITRRFAEQGYVALAVDLVSGRNRTVCMARLFGGLLLNSLNHGGIRDLRCTLTYLVGLPEVDGTRVGAAGYCMGGSLTIAWACTDDRLRAIAPYYAMNPRPLKAVARACPVVGSYPGADFTAKAGKQLHEELDRDQIVHDIKIYPGAKHSFFNEGKNHDPAAADDSWNRVLGFFAEQIGSGGPR